LLLGCSPKPTPTPTPTPIPVPPDDVASARDWGITQANLAGKAVPMNAVWTAQNITPENLVGYTTWQFTYSDQSGSWRITVGFPIVLNPNYDVKIYQNNVSIWEGQKTS
ncbi:MAG: hypothetical protein NTX88_06625, partial [Candidatus Atribacteria bacterium]|nr:hypothetical protein [Candidatus Atribacteria bacterium]